MWLASPLGVRLLVTGGAGRAGGRGTPHNQPAARARRSKAHTAGGRCTLPGLLLPGGPGVCAGKGWDPVPGQQPPTGRHKPKPLPPPQGTEDQGLPGSQGARGPEATHHMLTTSRVGEPTSLSFCPSPNPGSPRTSRPEEVRPPPTPQVTPTTWVYFQLLILGPGNGSYEAGGCILASNMTQMSV